MKKRTGFGFAFLVPVLLLLVACRGTPQVVNDTPEAIPGETPTAESDLPVSESGFGITVEGRIVPSESVNLSFETTGRVVEVLVEEGDILKTGDVIARLGDRELVEANLANAEQARVSAESALSTAKLASLEAQKAYDELYKDWPVMATQARQDLTDSLQAVHDTERDLNFLTSSAAQFDIDVAWAQVVLAEDALEDAEEKFEPYENKPDDNLERATYQSKLAQAQKAYEAAVRNYNAVRGTANEFDVSQAEASYNIALARLEQAQEDYEKLVGGPDSDEVTLAEARIETAEARITDAESAIVTAEANIAAAQAALGKLDLVAPMDGTLVEINLTVGEGVSPEMQVAVLADFSSWKVETFDLTEREVPRIFVGQQVAVTLDALPDLELSGTVEHISNLYTEKGGDITYTARILLNDWGEQLRWGMTAVVTFMPER